MAQASNPRAISWPVRLLLGVMCCVMIVGCVRSIEPLYSPDLSDLTMEPSLAGTWESSDGKLLAVFEPREIEQNLKGYVLHLTQRRSGENKRDLQGTFAVGVVKLGDRLYADVLPLEFPSKDDAAPESWWMLMQPTHTILWIEKIDAQNLIVQQPDGEKWSAAVKAYQATEAGGGLAAKIDNNSVLFYASPEELRKFVLSQGKNEGMFKECVTFRKISPATQPASNATQPAMPAP